MYRWGGKRLLDCVGSLVSLLMLLPVFAGIALAILLDDGRPVIYRQRRIGRNNQPFTLLKFRSMPVGTAELPSNAKELEITRVGRILRRTNLDELPQLVNVTRGEMSLVGPRPALASQVELLEWRNVSGASRCRPGLTGLAQINSYDGMAAVHKAEWDGVYSSTISFFGDIMILVKTVSYLRKPPPRY
jgi:O-antigen biosynthesis protein WbqP